MFSNPISTTHQNPHPQKMGFKLLQRSGVEKYVYLQNVTLGMLGKKIQQTTFWNTHFPAVSLDPFNPEIETNTYSNSVDPDETARKEPSYQDLHCYSILDLQQWTCPNSTAEESTAKTLEWKSSIKPCGVDYNIMCHKITTWVANCRPWLECPERSEVVLTVGSEHSIQTKIITKTCLYNFDPLKSNFYIVKLGFTGVHRLWVQKHRLWVLVRRF